MSLRLSVLDQSPVSQGSTGADALRNSVDLARLTEQLGYTRYWVAEHHATPMLACASPEVLIAAIGSATSRIRVGSGGVMLPHYSPLKVAETFSMLSGLYGERVDLADRPRAGERSGDGVRPPARSAHGRTGRLSRAAGRAAGLRSRPHAGHAPFRAAREAAGRHHPSRRLAARVVSAERPVGGRTRPALRVCGLHQSRRRRDRAPLSRRTSRRLRRIRSRA